VLSRQGLTVAVKLEAGNILQASLVVPAKVGDAVWVSIRPERVRISEGDDPQNKIQVQITNITYLGDAVRCILRTPNNEEVVMKLSVTDAERMPRAGQSLHVCLQPKSISVFPQT